MTDTFPKELTSPDGRTFVATSAREYNDLVYGSGYTEKVKANKPAETAGKVKFAKGDEGSA